MTGRLAALPRSKGRSTGRLAALALALAAAALGDAHAAPAGARALPAHWHELPAVMHAVTGALAPATVDHIAAWGDPAAGCFAADVVLRGAAGEAAVVRDEMLGSLRADPRLAGLVVHATAARPDGGSDVTFERAPYQGTLRVTPSTTGEVEVFACVWNQREPVTCTAACAQLLGGG
jgi:hypothetical protein